jgi:SAM-dependent methyltransferase
LYLESAPVVALAGWMAGIAATLLGWQGVVASTSGSVLVLARGAYQVTGECIATPVIPVGVAAALAMPWPWGRRALALLAVGPIFVALGIARLLVLAIPTAIADAPLFWTHAFFQLLTALVAVVAVVVWRHREDSRWSLVGGRALIAAGVGLGVAVLFGFRYAQAVQDVALTLSASWIGSNGASLVTASDPQRALMLLPPFQLGLFVALAIAGTAAWNPKRWAGALGVLVLSQVLLFVALHGMAASSGLTMPVPGVRAWAVGAPLVLLFVAGPLSVRTETSGYQGFWEEVGREFPDLAGASSTEYYFDNETRLLSEHLPTLRGIRILKTDLWDEAKNTRILQWAARQGAQAFGVDISHPIAQQARHQFVDHRLGAAAADVRHLPFADGQFDAIYSMGTIEHFDDSDVAVAEMFRVLKPGGRAIVGVPNRADPFLRPALVYVMQRVGAYGYGAERSFSRRALNRMLTSHGFDVVAETGILFMPGWLRMLDLACHSWCRPLTPVTRAMVAPFRFLDGRLRGLRRHGYLLATVAVKPDRRG